MKCSRTACHSHNLTHKHTSIFSKQGGPNVYCEGCAKKINQVNGQTLLVELSDDELKRVQIDPDDGRPYVGLYLGIVKEGVKEGDENYAAVVRNVMKEQLETLDTLQKPCNQGRGIQVVRDIIAVINAGMVDAAARIAIHDNDKIRNYPEVQKHLRTMLPAYDEQLKSFEQTFKWLTETEHDE